MIRVYTQRGELFEFGTVREAGQWIAKFPEKYGHDKTSLLILSDKKFSDLLEIQEMSDEHVCLIQCDECATLLKFRRRDHEHHFRVHCPECDGVTEVEI